MARYALIKPDNGIDRVSSDITGGSAGETQAVKAGFKWLPVELAAKPAASAALETASLSHVVGATKVTQQWTVTRRPLDEQKAAIKAEARRRILARYPDWKQANMTARGAELTHVKVGKAWTAEEQAEADALQAAWDWVKSVRSASDVLEAADPIPADFASSKHWPE